MRYHIWDNDNSVMVCDTDSRKEAFTAVLNHLIKVDASDASDPIMCPAGDLSKDCWSLIRQAQLAYARIIGFIPVQ